MPAQPHPQPEIVFGKIKEKGKDVYQQQPQPPPGTHPLKALRKTISSKSVLFGSLDGFKRKYNFRYDQTCAEEKQNKELRNAVKYLDIFGCVEMKEKGGENGLDTNYEEEKEKNMIPVEGGGTKDSIEALTSLEVWNQLLKWTDLGHPW
ncbi:hypothetical protein RIF29_31340 [Crotalaria pallida]|uniref:Uncharacterized protein n=1 Tax=Crotalaria pallida TaxID=3830 RepID=A0AAN9HX57_CROPI